jgi:hypothetical protein
MNWTIGTVIICTLVLGSQIGSAFSRFGNALADELDTIKERLDRLEQLNRDQLNQLKWIRSVLNRLDPEVGPLDRLTPEQIDRLTPGQLDLLLSLKKEKS